MPTIMDKPSSRRDFTPEEVDAKLDEIMKREMREFREFWKPYIAQLRRQERETDEDAAGVTDR